MTLHLSRVPRNRMRPQPPARPTGSCKTGSKARDPARLPQSTARWREGTSASFERSVSPGPRLDRVRAMELLEGPRGRDVSDAGSIPAAFIHSFILPANTPLFGRHRKERTVPPATRADAARSTRWGTGYQRTRRRISKKDALSECAPDRGRGDGSRRGHPRLDPRLHQQRFGGGIQPAPRRGGWVCRSRTRRGARSRSC
jgi:hypothetical protein